MKKMMMILALLFAMVGSSFGNNYAAKVKCIFTGYSNGMILVRTEPSVATLFPTATLQDYIAFEPTSSDTQKVLAVLLSAQAAYKNVYFVVDNGRMTTEGRPLATRLGIGTF